MAGDHFKETSLLHLKKHVRLLCNQDRSGRLGNYGGDKCLLQHTHTHTQTHTHTPNSHIMQNRMLVDLKQENELPFFVFPQAFHSDTE